jgi:hypothetical protein
MATFDDNPRFKCRPHPPHDRVLYATAVLAPGSTRSARGGFPRSRTFRFNVARLPATPTRPSRGPWLAVGLCCPDGSSLTTASSEPLDSSPPLMNSRRRPLHPRKSAWGGNPEGPQFTPLDCARVPPPLPRWPRRVQMTVASSSVLAFTSELRVRRPHWSFRGCRVHSELNSRSYYGPRAG